MEPVLFFIRLTGEFRNGQLIQTHLLNQKLPLPSILAVTNTVGPTLLK
jgi:hypothetical protein